MYVRDEDDSVTAFYKTYAEFTPLTPESISRFVERIRALTGLPRDAETYPIDDETLRRTANAFATAAKEIFDFELDVTDADSAQLDRFANQHLVDENLREFFAGEQVREDLSDSDAERYGKAVDASTIPNEPLLFYAMGSFWGERLIAHRAARWVLYEPLRIVQSFPDMMTIDTTVCMHPFSHVVKKLADPEGDQLSFKAHVSSTMKRFFPPYALIASIADAEEASRASLPPEATDAIAHQQAGRTQEAFEAYEAAIARAPDNAALYAMATGAAWQLENWEHVELWLQKALELAPENPALHHNLAVLYCGFEGGMDPAIELLQQAVSLDPRYGRARITLASCLAETGRLHEAREHANWVVENDGELEEEAKAVLKSLG